MDTLGRSKGQRVEVNVATANMEPNHRSSLPTNKVTEIEIVSFD